MIKLVKKPIFMLSLSFPFWIMALPVQAVVTQNPKENHAAEGKKEHNKNVGHLLYNTGVRGTILPLSPRIMITNRHMIVNSADQTVKSKESVASIQFEDQVLTSKDIETFVPLSDTDLGLVILKASLSLKAPSFLKNQLYNPSVHGPIIPGLTPLYGTGWGRATEYDDKGQERKEELPLLVARRVPYVRSAFISFLGGEMGEAGFCVENKEILGKPKHPLSGGSNYGDSGGRWGVFLDSKNRVIHDLGKISTASSFISLGVNVGGSNFTSLETLNRFSSESVGIPLNKKTLEKPLQDLRTHFSQDGSLTAEVDDLINSLPSFKNAQGEMTSLDHLLNLKERANLSLYQSLIAHASFELYHSQQPETEKPGSKAYLWRTVLYKLSGSSDHTIKPQVGFMIHHYQTYWEKYQLYSFLMENTRATPKNRKKERKCLIKLEDRSDEEKGFTFSQKIPKSVHVQGINHNFTLASYLCTLNEWVEKAAQGPCHRLYSSGFEQPDISGKIPPKSLDHFKKEAWEEIESEPKGF